MPRPELQPFPPRDGLGAAPDLLRDICPLEDPGGQGVDPHDDQRRLRNDQHLRRQYLVGCVDPREQRGPIPRRDMGRRADSGATNVLEKERVRDSQRVLSSNRT